ncbi:MAG: hypothetical protein ACLUKN_16260 [Bacilli bacterium]
MIAEDVDMANFDGKRKIWIPTATKSVRLLWERSINDGAYSAIESPEIKEGMEVVVGTESLSHASASSSNPFMPKMPQRKRGNNNTKTTTKK